MDDLKKFEKELVDKGLLVEAGWASLRHFAIAKDAPAAQIAEMRKAFFAGATHLFQSIMSILDAGDEATEDDTRRLDLIHTELENFVNMHLGNLHKQAAQPEPMQHDHSPSPRAEADPAHGIRMHAVAQTLDEFFNGKVRGDKRENGFVLLVFKMGEEATGGPSNLDYISNGVDRRDITVLFKELIARFEGQAEVTGRA